MLNNTLGVMRRLGVLTQDVVFANPFFQRKTQTQAGCQIDLAIQTRFNIVYACEIKLSKSAVKPAVIDEVKNKLAALVLPRQFSLRPVLIHVNGVHPDVFRSQFFARIIDFGELLS